MIFKNKFIKKTIRFKKFKVMVKNDLLFLTQSLYDKFK